MVFLAITKTGLNDVLRTAAEIGATVWCGADAISEVDYAKRHYKKLSRFDYELADRDQAALADAIQTINEHHPGEVVWVEGANTGG